MSPTPSRLTNPLIFAQDSPKCGNWFVNWIIMDTMISAWKPELGAGKKIAIAIGIRVVQITLILILPVVCIKYWWYTSSDPTRTEKICSDSLTFLFTICGMGLSEWLRHLAESSISAKFREIDNHINVVANGVATNANGVATNANGVATNANGVATNANGVATNANRIDAGETRIDMVVTEAASTTTRLDNRIDKCTMVDSQYIPPHMMPTLFTHLNSSSTQLPPRLPDTYRETFEAVRDMYEACGSANEDCDT
jgi:hypothetical protein